jgi:tetratricopeptide (TPR) repeat protein
VLSGIPADAARGLLASAAERALAAAARLPSDPRPRLVAGSVRLVENKPREALDFYRDALGTGERAEIDLNLGRAHALAGERPEAQAALVRALWVSPALATALPKPVSRRLLEEIAKRENELRAGLLREPPALPD